MTKRIGSTDVLGRRAFLVGLATSAVAGAPAASAALAIQPGADRGTDPTKASEEDVLLAVTLQRFGGYLNGDDIDQVKKGLSRIIRMRAELDKVPIHNGDAPDCLFNPDRR